MKMRQLKPKAWHEHYLANADKEKILQHLQDGQERNITRIAVALARQCDFFADFARLWTLRVTDLEARLGSERYMKTIYMDRRGLYKALKQEDRQ